jgi:site-specific DNA-methyltransferase (adenine-specific)
VAKRWILVFTDDLNVWTWAGALTRAGAQYVVKGTWVKRDPMPQMTGDRPAYGSEEIVIAHAHREKGRMRWNGGGRAAVYIADARNQGERVHPTQKPLPVVEMLIRDFTDPGDLILDAFAGSGTTGVAAKRLGRRFIGWERDAKYHAIAEKRIANTREQLRFFESASEGRG